MPNLKIERERFFELMGRKWEFEQLDKLGFEFGVEIEEDIEKDKEGNIVKDSLKFDCMNNRPDLLSQSSLTRAFKIYLGLQNTPQLRLIPPTTSITVDPSVKQIRPYIAAAILRNVKFDEKIYKAFIAAQEKLHDTFCRARKYASIGTHDLDTIQGPFSYVAKDPKDFSFIPLNQTETVDGLGMCTLLENHKLKEYLPLIRDSPVYPLVLDAKGRVCSVPPIINSEHSKISINTKNILIEVTALNRPKAMICINNIVWAFAEYCAGGFEVEAVEIHNGEDHFSTPDLKERQYLVSHTNAEKMVGAKLDQENVVGYLKRTGLTATIKDENHYHVRVPFWRGDVLHECDILEDIAICYGYTKIVPRLPESATVGGRVRLNKFTDFLRQEMAQAQYNEMLNFALCSRADVTTNIGCEKESHLIRISNAKTKEFQTGRTTLVPGLLRTVVQSRANPLPYKFFEAGDCIIANPSTDTGACNLRKLAALITDEVLPNKKKGIFSILHGALDLILKKANLSFGKDYSLEISNNELFFAGQQFQIKVHGEHLGWIGVVHPKVLKNFDWCHPTALWEIDVTVLQKYYTESFK